MREALKIMERREYGKIMNIVSANRGMMNLAVTRATEQSPCKSCGEGECQTHRNLGNKVEASDDDGGATHAR
jgi:hypothetical protein